MAADGKKGTNTSIISSLVPDFGQFVTSPEISPHTRNDISCWGTTCPQCVRDVREELLHGACWDPLGLQQPLSLQQIFTLLIDGS